MSKFVALENEYEAKGWAHAQALRAGEGKVLYPKGAKVGKDGSIELPDDVVEKLKLSTIAKATKAEAVAQRIEKVKPTKPTKPLKDRIADTIKGKQ